MKNNRLTRLITFGAFLFLMNTGYAQDKTSQDKIKAIADKACKCTEEISDELPKDSIISKINACITTFIIEDQTSGNIDEMLGKVEGAIKASGGKDTTMVVEDNKTYTIIIDKDFDEIQAYLRENCLYVKTLIVSENIKLDNSMSKNEKALAFYREGEDYYRQGKYDLALVSFNKAVKADAKFAFAWDNLGICYRKMENFKEAIKCYEKSLKLDPKGKMPLINMAVAYEFLKDYKSSGETYLKYIQLHPDDPEGFFGAGRIFYIAGDYEKGVDNMFKAYIMYSETQSPYLKDAQQNLAFYYDDLKEKGKFEIFEKAAINNGIVLE